jgi:quinoprotein glucose dehydrogenase
MNAKILCALALLGSIAAAGAQDRSAKMVEWPYVAGDQGAARYSPLADLNADTVKRLELAWQWKAPDRPMPEFGTTPGNFNSTPLMINNVLYVTTNYNRLVALDADTGAERWAYDPKAYEGGMPALAGGFRHRGVAAWREGQKLRIFLASRYRLMCLDAETGALVPTFGIKGIVDLSVGLPKTINKDHFEYNSAPVIYKNLVIVGGASGDSLIYHNAPTGDVRAYDATTGRQVWIFHVVPQAGEFGRDTWENESWKFTGKTTAWAGVTVDEPRGLVYVPVGEPNNNYYGGRRLGDNLFADSVVCLDANTGKRKWHFQTLHHPLFDYDLPAQPNLMTITVNGRKVDAVAQITKQGLLFVFDRVTGKPVWPIEERPVPASDIPGERTAPTQPFPTKPPPFAASQGVALDDAFDLTPDLKAAAQAEMQKFRLGPLYTPGSLQGTLTQPGGANWGGGAFDPESGLLYIKTSSTVGVLKLEKFDPATSRNPFAKTNEDVGYDTARTGGGGSFRNGVPLNKPPYAHLVAVDMNKGEIAWRVPFGAGSRSLRANPALKGLALPDRLGSPGAPGSIVTKGGLVFAGGGDAALYAFDKATGREVWSAPIPRPTTATPMTYRSRAGRQFVVIATGSGSDQVLMAFAVPAGASPTP